MKPLAGLKVVELARILAGPWAGQALADLGADVIKVEKPGTGDDTRQWGPPFVSYVEGGRDAAYFHSCNRGKRSIAVDFERPEGQDIIRRLVGPYANRPGYDFMIQGMGGIMDLTGAPDGDPMKVGVAYADIFTGLYAVIGIQSALIRRSITGEGGYVDMALLDTQVGVLANQAMNYLASGIAPTRMGNQHPNIVPYRVFPVSDGYIIIACGNDRQWRDICDVLGVTEFGADHRYATNAARIENRDELNARIDKLTVQHKRDELLSLLEAANVPAGPINNVADVFNDPHVIHRGMQQQFDLKGGTVATVRSPIVLDAEGQMADTPSPRLGQHTHDILAEIGFNESEIQGLKVSGIAG